MAKLAVLTCGQIVVAVYVCVYVSVALKMNNVRDLGAQFMHSLSRWLPS